MGNYYHWKDIKELLITQTLDGERKPLFQVRLEHGALPSPSADVENDKAHHLYVWGDFGKTYAYVAAPDDEDKHAYRTLASEHLKFKTRKVQPA